MAGFSVSHANCRCTTIISSPHKLRVAFDSGPSMLPSRRRNHCAALKTKATAEPDSTLTKAVVAAGLVANPVVLVSEYFLKTTGEGLPPGPGGIYGATEGISYLVIVGVVGWSIYTKVGVVQLPCLQYLSSSTPGTLIAHQLLCQPCLLLLQE
ncbi:hypothetical protein WJX79_004525 [Trebouxia sp. C0005]